MSECPSPTTLVGLVTDNLPAPGERARVEEHVRACEACRTEAARLERALAGRSLRTTFRILSVGFLCGGLLMGVGVTSQAVSQLLKNCSATYAKFPSLEKPWVLRLEPATWEHFSDLPSLARLPLSGLGLVGGTCLGLFIVRAVRPRSLRADVDLGLRTGLVAGVCLYVFGGVGWATALALTTVPSIQDQFLIAKGYGTVAPPPKDESVKEPRRHPQEALLKQYPDLSAEPEHERANILATKIVADSVVGSLEGVLVGLWLSLAAFVPAGVYQTAVAGYLYRRHGRWKDVLVPYLELTITGTYLLAAAGGFLLTLTPFDQNPSHALRHVVPPALMTWVAWRGILRGWPLLFRGALLAAVGLTSYFVDVQGFGWSPVGIFMTITADVAAVLAVGSLRKAQQPPTADTPTTTPTPDAPAT